MTSRSPLEIDASRQPPLGMPPERFLREYWQKRPLLIRNAMPGFVSPVSPDELAGLACEELALSRLVRHDRRRARYSVEFGPFAGVPGRDWSPLAQDLCLPGCPPQPPAPRMRTILTDALTRFRRAMHPPSEPH